MLKTFVFGLALIGFACGGGNTSAHVDAGAPVDSMASVDAMIPPGATVPAAPTGVMATHGAGAATVTWQAPTNDGGTPVTGYRLSSTPEALTVDVTDTIATITGLTNGTSYTFSVYARNAVGEGLGSLPSNPVTPGDVPAAPTNVIAQSGSRQATLTWAAPQANGRPITGYVITTNPGGATSMVTDTAATITGLRNGQDYSFEIVAHNALGAGPAGASNVVRPMPVVCAAANVTFENASVASALVGTLPIAAAHGDANEDGNADVFVANFSSHNVSVLLGTGTAQLNAGVTLSAGTNPRDLVSADFNGDNHIDLAVANGGSNDVAVFLGNGLGGFGNAVSYPVGTSPHAVAVGDFTGDGRLDLVTANNSAHTVSMLAGASDGTFAAAVHRTALSEPIDLGGADVDQDGDLDLLLSHGASGSLFAGIMVNTGTGTFGNESTINTSGTSLRGLRIGDFNEDGDADFAIVSSSASNMFIHRGLAGATFSGPTTVATGALPLAVDSGDFNADGNTDLAIANYSSGTAQIVFGDGAGNFGTSKSYGQGAQPRMVLVVDLDNDLVDDFVLIRGQANTVIPLLAGCTP